MTDLPSSTDTTALCPFCKQAPGQKFGPPAMARCINPECEGAKLGAVTLAEWNAPRPVDAAQASGDRGAFDVLATVDPDYAASFDRTGQSSQGGHKGEAAAAQISKNYVISQHIGWLKQYIAEMTADNWQDMRLRAERQLDELSKGIRDDAYAVRMREALELIQKQVIERGSFKIERNSGAMIVIANALSSVSSTYLCPRCGGNLTKASIICDACRGMAVSSTHHQDAAK